MPRSYYRRGPDHRGGAPVTFLDVRRRFQFRTVEIGRWVTEPEKQGSAALFYDALCDLMTILGGTETLISLRGTLALQYGIGGQPAVSAHYTPATRSFALAKNAGVLYFSKPEELCARAFEAFVHDADCKNEFLVKGTRETDEAGRHRGYRQGQRTCQQRILAGHPIFGIICRSAGTP
ncbi:LPD1 domain-containing protein [Marinobacter sp.]|uniref:LPD1 domain-containing protein n=1 Tax=Marinobacter sp. TaxID=50741 RepID=UPI0035634046